MVLLNFRPLLKINAVDLERAVTYQTSAKPIELNVMRESCTKINPHRKLPSSSSLNYFITLWWY